MILLPFNRHVSFLSNFAKRTFTVNDQVKIINDFLAVSFDAQFVVYLLIYVQFISGQMRTCDVWKSCSDAEFDNAMEGMEKLLMNRLYDLSVLFLICLRDGH